MRDLSKLQLDDEPDPTGGAVRAVRFSPSGGSLITLSRSKNDETRILLHTLQEDKTRTISVGPGRVWRAGFSKDGRWLHATVVRADTNGNGKLDLPEIRTTHDGDPCGQALSSSSYGLKEGHDEIESVLLPLNGGPVRPQSGVQGHLEADLIRRLEDGTLVREDAQGKQVVLAPASCGGVLDYYALEYGRWLVGCYAPGEDRSEHDPGHIWLFGDGIPKTGKQLGIEVEYGVDEGYFGTRRFSRLRTKDRVVYFDLKLNELLQLPEGLDGCDIKGSDFMLHTAGFSPPPKPGGAPRPIATYLWSPGGEPRLVASGDCERLGEDYLRVGHQVYSWSKRGVVGDLTPLCEDNGCSGLDYRPFVESGFFLLAEDRDIGLDAAGLERSLRSSLVHLRERSLAQVGPLTWRTWVPPAGTAHNAKEPLPRQKPEPSGVDDAASCEILSAPISVQPSALPSWTKLDSFSAQSMGFPRGAYTSDSLPTRQFLETRICDEVVWSVLIARLMDAAVGYDSKKARIGETVPAFEQMWETARVCSDERACSMGHALFKSDVAQAEKLHEEVRAKARELAHRLLLSCDLSTSKQILLGDDVSPDVQIEWLMAGKGRSVRTPQNLERALRATFEKMDEYVGRQAIARIAQDTRPDVVQMLLRFRESATPEMFKYEPQYPDEEAPDEEPDPRFEFDLSVGSAKSARLRSLFAKRCETQPTRQSFLGKGQSHFRCELSSSRPPELKHVRVEAELDRKRIESWTDSLHEGRRTLCADALGGVCPQIGFVAFPLFQGTWEALYTMLTTLVGAPRESSPLSGLTVDSPLRTEKGKLVAAFRAWGDGKVYQSGTRQLAKTSLGWKGAKGADGISLAKRGFLGWLNAVAEARKDQRRFAWVEGYPAGVVIARPEQLCKLAKARLMRTTVSPAGRSSSY